MKSFNNTLGQSLTKFSHAGLVARMTLCVVLVVTLVSGIILYVASLQMTSLYDRQLREHLSESADATASALKLRMSRVQFATQTAASLAKEDAQHFDQLDTLLIRTMQGIGCVDMVQVIYEHGFFPQYKGDSNYVRAAFYTDSLDVQNFSTRDELAILDDDDENWIYSYIYGRPCLSTPYDEDISGFPVKMLCYSVPLFDECGRRYGIFCTNVRLSWLTEIVHNMKAHPDFDVMVYNTLEGDTVIDSSEEIKLLLAENPDLLIEETRLLPELEWEVRMTAPVSVISDRVNTLLAAFVRFALLLLLTMTVAVVFVVRFIGKPFAIRQQKTESDKAVMQREFDIAAGTQRELVPHVFPAFPERKDIDLYACLHPAFEVGGDLYDYFINNDRLYFCIGDVSGKGAPASLFMAATHYLFRSVASSLPMSEAVGQINRSLCTDNAQCTFVTFWFGCLDLKTGQLDYVNAGHNAPILITRNGAEFLPVADNMPLGVFEEAGYTTRHFFLHPEESLMLYTDGVTESMDTNNRELGDSATLAAASQCADMPAEQIVNYILRRVHAHADGAVQSDDITILVLRKR